MKAICNREGLLAAFQIASGVAPVRTTKEILKHVKLETDGAADPPASTLTATDMELGVHYRVAGVQSEQDGQVVLPTANVVAILRELSDEEIELRRTDSGVELIGSTSRFELPTEDPLLYPTIPDVEDETTHRIAAGVLTLMIRRTQFASAAQGSRFAYHSVAMAIDGEGHARMVATDGKRLALMPGAVTLGGDPPESPALLPIKTLSLLLKVLTDPEEEVELTIRENDARFKTARVTVYSRLVEGRFPRYQDVIPKETPIQIALPAAQFAAALRQAKILADDELPSRGVDFQFDAGTLTLESRGASTGQSVVRLPVSYDGEKLKITYEPQLLLDALKVIDPDVEVTLNIVDQKKASVLSTPDDYTYLVMPIYSPEG